MYVINFSVEIVWNFYVKLECLLLLGVFKEIIFNVYLVIFGLYL